MNKKKCGYRTFKNFDIQSEANFGDNQLLRPGTNNLITDISGIFVGNSHDEQLRSGVTVIMPDSSCVASIDLRGGGTGTRDTELLSTDGTVERIDGIVLSGGSAFGLDAAGGVMRHLQKTGKGLPIRDIRVPIVPQAILFDLLNGGNKNWADTPPYWQLGYKAASSPKKKFKLGNNGAGFGAIAGNIKGGLGSASIYLPSLNITIGAIAAVNSAGSVLIPGSKAFYAWDMELGNEFGGIEAPENFDKSMVEIPKHSSLHENTTLAVVATDAKLTKSETRRLAMIAQNGVSRAIRPSSTPLDGDIVFALSTGKQNIEDKVRNVGTLGAHASNCLARSIARAVYEAETLGETVSYRDFCKNNENQQRTRELKI